MNKLKVCFIGVGSIARRHIRNLTSVCNNRHIELTVDALRSSISPEAIPGINNVFYGFDALPFDYDAIFVANPTNMHLETLYKAHSHAKHFFIEKPAVSFSQVEEARRFTCRPDSVYYVAGPLRFHPVIQYLKKNINIDEIVAVRSISSSYLPDWRPGQDYRKTYSAHKDMGGGVSIDLIHEWDYLTFLFGWPQTIKSLIGKKSSLEIDSDDFAIYIAEYPSMIAELHLDYFGRKTIREIELITKTDTIIGDLTNCTIAWLKSGNKIVFGEERDDYQKRELEYFLDLILQKIKTENGFYRGTEVLELTQGIITFCRAHKTN